MNKEVQRMLIKGERRLRILLYGFCAYSLIYAVITNVFSKYADTILHNYIFIVFAGVFSFFGGLVVDEEVEKTKEICEWSWDVETKADYYCMEFNGLVWIGTFYVVVQLGIGMFFFPEYDQIKIGSGGQPLYPFVFLFNSIIIYIIYRLTIIKIKFIEPEHNSF